MILPPEIRDLVTALRREIEVLRAENAALRQRVADLQRQLDKNSSNSSKPPSSDGLKKPPRVASGMRGKSGKTSGGQVGHAGGTLKQVAKPDVVERHEAQACRHCLAGLTAAMVKGVEKRQVFDLPEPRLDVTEHQAMIYRCACCRGLTTAAFPRGWPRRPSTARGSGRRRFISMCSSSFPRTGSRRRWPTCSAQRRFVQTASSPGARGRPRNSRLSRRGSPSSWRKLPCAISTKPAFASPARANGSTPPRPRP